MSEVPPHKFWNQQPVVQRNEKPQFEGQLQKDNKVEDVKADPLRLVKGFSWSVVDTKDEKQRTELYDFLREHYVTHPQNTFRFAYSAEFLDWALHPPGWRPEWLVGVRADATGKLVAFISAIPITVRVKEEVLHIVAVDFLSVHKRLRGKNLAPVLIQEITRRVNLTGIFTAIFTAGREINQYFTKARYRHRLVEYEKLCAIQFTSPKIGEDVKAAAKRYQIAKQPRLPGWREMTPEDVPVVTAKLNEDLKKYKVAQVFSEEEVAHWFLPRPGIVGSYVIEQKKEVKSFISFYLVPSTVSGCEQYDSYMAAYLFYYFVKPSHTFTDVIRAAVCVAHHEYHADVINCLDIMENKEMLETLHFVQGDGCLHYYFFNYATETVAPEEVGVVLL